MAVSASLSRETNRQAGVKRPIYFVARAVSGIAAQDVFRAGDGLPRALWMDAKNGETLAGLGSLRQLTAEGPGRFVQIQEQVKTLVGQLQNLSAGGITPRLMGGFSFRETPEVVDPWQGFQAAQFLLPEIQLISRAGEGWLLALREGSPEDSPEELHGDLCRKLDEWHARIESARQGGAAPQSNGVTQESGTSEAAWQAMVLAALERIERTDLKKLVISRYQDYGTKSLPDLSDLAGRLVDKFSQSFVFAFEPVVGATWVGATPERLFKVCERKFETMALAGSARRGENRATDARAGERLLRNPKERREHELVVEDIRAALQDMSAELVMADEPILRKLPYIQHLETAARGRLKEGLGVLDGVAALHPTAALCGFPRQLARQQLERIEAADRGWFGSPIGWLDFAGNGDFSVGIRAALVRDERVRLYAGAGIVPGSEAEREWGETELKMQPMKRALFGGC